VFESGCMNLIDDFSLTLIQIRSRLASLDGIVPSTHGFMVGSSSMKNVWLSMEHQSILWCNQLAVQVGSMR
jgi:hypothetical protein